MSKSHHIISDLVSYERGERGVFEPIEWLLAEGWSPLRIMMANKFVMGRETDIPAEFLDFGGELLERGLLRLPFEDTIFEFEIDRKTKKIGDESSSIYVLNWITVLAQQAVDKRISARIIYHENGAINIPDAAVIFGPENGPCEVKHYRKDYAKTDEAAAYEAIGLISTAVAAISSKSTKTELVEAPERLNKARLKKGRVPLSAFHKVTLPGKPAGGVSGEGHHASPRMHWRRGHYRTLSWGQVVPVSPCLVGVIEGGFIEKEYVWKNANNPK